MKVMVTLDYSADGYYTEEEELACLKQMLEDLDSAAVNVSVLYMKKVEQ